MCGHTCQYIHRIGIRRKRNRNGKSLPLISKYRSHQPVLGSITLYVKAAYSVTMNIFRQIVFSF